MSVGLSCVFLYLIQYLAHSKCSLNIFCIKQKIVINFLFIRSGTNVLFIFIFQESSTVAANQ